MDATVFLAVLAAALMHAGWNAVVKGGGDPFVTVTHVSLFSGLLALVAMAVATLAGWLPLLPRPGAWVWILASAALHTVYRFMLIGAYRAGDMSQVYPIMRGAAPLLTAVGTALLIGEVISPLGFAAVTLLSLGVFLMSLRGGRLAAFDPRAVGFALASAASTCGYTLVDGIGARLNGSGPGYALWMFVCNMLAMQAAALAWRGPSVYAGLPATWAISAGGGLMSMGAYFIVIWGMTKAPIALVAALRETSVLFGALIAAAVLREPLTPWRLAASATVVLGVLLLRVA